jgi:hypothetical protein
MLSGGFGVSIDRLREFQQVFEGLLAEYSPAQPLHVGTQRPAYVTDNETDARAVVPGQR